MGARFVRLGIAGFKSFADQVSLEILPGLTGVVGPNGCGKSNVAEALRWAMGEANARHLRGGEMDDVIFAGSANRPSRNLAEVSLTLEEDEAGGLPPPFAGQAEIQVTRRLERGSGSAYRVNGREARARDVQTLFADLASGARSSAMVSQGRVGALVNARPDERRAVLEEAAGITGLHARRAEAETRLRAAETNLERAEERRLLLETQLNGLRTQARQAARYRTLMTAVLEAEAATLSIQRARALSACVAAEAALAEAVAAVETTAAQAGASIIALDAAQALLPALRDQEAAARTMLERTRLAEEERAAEAARTAAALSAAVQRQAQIARDLAHAEGVLSDAGAADQRLAAEAERLETEALRHPADLEAAYSDAAAAAAALQTADDVARDAATRAAELRARRAAAEQILQQADARARRAQEVVARLAAERSRAAADFVDPETLAASITALAASAADLVAAREAQERAEAGRNDTAATAASQREAHSAADAARHRLTVEAAALAEVLAVKDDERWPPMIDRVTVPAGLEAALGAALGEELGAAADQAAARHWRHLPDPEAVSVPGQRLADSVVGPPQLARALSGIGLVATDADGDAGQAALRPGQCLVSRTGAVWRWDGYTVRAGTPTAAAVRLQQRNRLAALQLRVAEAQAVAAGAHEAKLAADLAARLALAAEQQARVSRRDAETRADQARTAAAALRSRADLSHARLALLDEQSIQIGSEAEGAASAFAAARRDHALLPDLAQLRAAADTAASIVVQARTRDTTAARTLDATQRAEQARQTRRAAIVQEREDRRMRAADLADRVKDLQARASEAAAEQARLASVPVRASDDAAARRLDQVEAASRSATAAREAAERGLAQLAIESRALDQARYAARETLARAEMTLAAAEEARAVAESRTAEREHALPAFPAPADTSLAAEERARGRLQRLTRERDEMGPVNLRAEIEADALGADIGTIIREREELGTAIAKLRGSIGHLNREGRERLSAVFQQVDRQFQALFGRMFGGGRAHLALVGSDDPLQAGLEIYAQPPGKKLTTLSLLSGGEQALTALSLIFAVFRCNPAPLCVLDEVDAPLDDANVERLCSLLSDMARETGTRFLVVTHHALTMARMDRLYGVTMQERGVSRLLSVDLSRAAEVIEAIAAE